MEKARTACAKTDNSRRDKLSFGIRSAGPIESLEGANGCFGWQISVARRTTDLQALQTFLRDAKDHEGALLRAKSQEERDQAFIEFLNFLEAYSAAVNGKLFPKASRGIVVDKIVDALTAISDLPEWHGRFEAAITSHTTFSALRRFMEKHRKALTSARAVRGELTTPN